MGVELLECRMLFVDDHPLVLSGLTEMLRAQGCQVTTARTIDEAMRHLGGAAMFDLMLLDINLAQENGLLLLESPPPGLPQRVILVSGMTEQEWILHGFALGAFGFVPKSVEPEELVAALRLMKEQARAPHSGWVWDTQSQGLVDAQDFFPRHTLLTPKEREVFLLLRAGKLDKQIADELGLSIHTVRVHIRAIKRKRGHNRRFEQNF